MINTRRCATAIYLFVFLIPWVHAQDLSSYRNFHLGMTLAAVAKQADVKASEARPICQRPALIQQLEWRPESSFISSLKADPIHTVLFEFYNGELFQILISYNQDRTEGLTDEDIIESIASKYGTPTRPAVTITIHSPRHLYSQDEKVIARWEDSQYSLNLFRLSYRSTPGMLFFSKRLELIAQAALVEASRLDAQEAPQREIDRQRKQDDEKHAAGQKVRPANKANFRP
jgi:hypothetical protein